MDDGKIHCARTCHSDMSPVLAVAVCGGAPQDFLQVSGGPPPLYVPHIWGGRGGGGGGWWVPTDSARYYLKGHLDHIKPGETGHCRGRVAGATSILYRYVTGVSRAFPGPPGQDLRPGTREHTLHCLDCSAPEVLTVPGI